MWEAVRIPCHYRGWRQPRSKRKQPDRIAGGRDVAPKGDACWREEGSRGREGIKWFQLLIFDLYLIPFSYLDQTLRARQEYIQIGVRPFYEGWPIRNLQASPKFRAGGIFQMNRKLCAGGCFFKHMIKYDYFQWRPSNNITLDRVISWDPLACEWFFLTRFK